MPQNNKLQQHAPLRWRTFAAAWRGREHRVVEAPHAIDATAPVMLNSYNLLLRIGQLVEEPLLVLRLGLVVRVVLLL